MAGMFYSLEEAAEKLGKTPDEVKQLAQEGKLREFRDGSALLFKIEEVDALQPEDVDLALDLGGAEVDGGAPRGGGFGERQVGVFLRSHAGDANPNRWPAFRRLRPRHERTSKPTSLL